MSEASLKNAEIIKKKNNEGEMEQFTKRFRIFAPLEQ